MKTTKKPVTKQKIPAKAKKVLTDAVSKTEKRLNDIKQKAELTKDIIEFVMRVDMNLSEPILNSGIIIPVEKKGVITPIIVVNHLNRSPFFTQQQCLDIKAALERDNSKTLRDIALICPTASVNPCFPGLPIKMLQDPIFGSALIGLFTFISFNTSTVSRVAGTKTDVRNFAARTKVYYNSYPAGLGLGTTIKMIPTNVIPHLANGDVTFFEFEPGSGRMVVFNKSAGGGTGIKTTVAPDLIEFYDYKDELAERSRVVNGAFDLMVIYEGLNDKLNAKTSKSKKK